MKNNISNLKIPDIKEDPPYKCKMCGLGDIQNSEDICNVCGWQDCGVQFNNPDLVDMPNGVSYNEYKIFWEENKEKIFKNNKTDSFYAIKLSKEYYKNNFKK